MASNTDHLRDVLGRVAHATREGLPVVSAYVDLRQDAAEPNVRSGLVVLRDRLRELRRGIPEHSPEGRSLAGDEERIGQAVDEQLPDAEAMVVFSCSGEGFFESAVLPGVVETQVSHGPVPEIVPLARIADRGVALIVLTDTNTLRLVRGTNGSLRELPGADEPPDEFGRHLAARGALDGRVEERRAAFARRAAERIDRAIAVHHPDWLLLAADDTALPYLRERLSPRATELLRETFHAELHIDAAGLAALVGPTIDRLRREDALDVAETWAGEVAEGDLGAAGIAAARAALEIGQGLQLLIADDAAAPADALAELAMLAARTDARIRFVEGDERLRASDGVGVLLRFRLVPAGEPATA
jgi:hypothetical protein